MVLAPRLSAGLMTGSAPPDPREGISHRNKAAFNCLKTVKRVIVRRKEISSSLCRERTDGDSGSECHVLFSLPLGTEGPSFPVILSLPGQVRPWNRQSPVERCATSTQHGAQLPVSMACSTSFGLGCAPRGQSATFLTSLQQQEGRLG